RWYSPFRTSHAHHPAPHSFPTRRSSDLQRVKPVQPGAEPVPGSLGEGGVTHHGTRLAGDVQQSPLRILDPVQWPVAIQCTGSRIDRKSTRLNSSHVKISYAVFCLKKKKK